jgi:hypothetical protein
MNTATVPDSATAGQHRDSSDSTGVGVASGADILTTSGSALSGWYPQTWSGRFSLLVSPGTTMHAHAGQCRSSCILS